MQIIKSELLKYFFTLKTRQTEQNAKCNTFEILLKLLIDDIDKTAR